MKRTLTCIGLLAGLSAVSGVAFGQAGADAPKFQIADIHTSPKSSSPNVFMRSGFYKGGRYEVRNGNMVDLISLAYGVDGDKVLSGPSWLEMHRYDVIAIAPPNTTPAALKPMLQNLLADRFKLVVHIDKKEMPTYALVAGKKPLLKEADGSGDTGCTSRIDGLPPQGTPITSPVDATFVETCRNMSMEAFAEAVRNMPLANQAVGSNPILDETELKGAWNFELHYAFPIGPGAATPSGASFLESVEKQLGLKLEPRKAPIPVVIVESANEMPTDNLPGTTEKLPVAPTEFEVADIKPSDPNGSPQNGNPFLPGGRLNLRGATLKQLIFVAWDLTPDKIVGGPKYLDDDHFDIVAKAPAAATSATAAGQGNQPPVDIDALRLMLRALLIDRFKLQVHMEDRPGDAYTLVAVKPKMKKADPANRTGFKEGPGPDGKDPRKTTPSLDRLVAVYNMTMAQFAESLPRIAGGYFQNASTTVVNATGLEGSFDFTLNFSNAGILNKNAGRGGRGGDAGPAPGGAAGAGEAADPGGGLTLFDAMEKQIGIKMEIQKRPLPVLVVDHIEQKPTDN